MFRKQSQVRHISYQELDAMLRELAYQLHGKVQGIKPQTTRDEVPAALLASIMKVPFGKGTEFSIFSDATPEICLFKKEYESEHYNRSVNYCIDTIYVDHEGKFQNVVFEWEKQ